jgi:hypothetical protein
LYVNVCSVPVVVWAVCCLVVGNAGPCEGDVFEFIDSAGDFAMSDSEMQPAIDLATQQPSTIEPPAIAPPTTATPA